jgi:chemotaxis receptor (MCP) glutamine deamidase CheD
VALERLAACGIRIRRRETGGDHGRKLLFNPHTGELLVRNLRGREDVARAGP